MMRLADCLDSEDAKFERVFAARHGWAEALYYAPRPYTHLSCKALEACGEPVEYANRLGPDKPVRWIEAHGKIRSVKEWSQETGLSAKTIYRRLSKGLDGAEALTPTWQADMDPEWKLARAQKAKQASAARWAAQAT